MVLNKESHKNCFDLFPALLRTLPSLPPYLPSINPWTLQRTHGTPSRSCWPSRKALRATMILVPLLGIQFIFFSSMPDENHSFKRVYQVLVALINSLQVGWLIDWLIGWLVVWLFGWLIERLIDWLVEWLIEWFDWLLVWVIDWLVG